MSYPKTLPDDATIGQVYGPAMEITTQADADAYFTVIVDHTMHFGKSRDEAVAVVRENIGYYTGYYDRETADRVMRLFNASHPIFGRSYPTTEEAFRTGVEYGEERKEQS